jgi:hypothetical protein
MAGRLVGSAALREDAKRTVMSDIPSPREWCMRITAVEVALEVGKSRK